MKSLRFIAAGVALAVVSVVSASAQTARPTGQPAAPASSAAAPSLTGKIAVIDSGAFADEKEGIARVVSAMKGIDAQFQPQRTELQNMQTRYNALVDEIQKTGSVADPKTLAAKQDQATQLKTDIERKAQDAQTAYQKRMGDVLDPLQQDVFNALQAYAQQRGIAIVIDQNRVPVLYAADSVDITKDFIAEYNRTHPATAAAATPGRP
ncbi:MAG: OmpH family outer membrane protein [Acidobacteriota bacterium]|nr:OmpH family outer membrane protein [Acidobacteriota bacterium]